MDVGVHFQLNMSKLILQMLRLCSTKFLMCCGKQIDPFSDLDCKHMQAPIRSEGRKRFHSICPGCAEFDGARVCRGMERGAAAEARAICIFCQQRPSCESESCPVSSAFASNC